MKKNFFIILAVILIGGLIFTSCSTSTTSTSATTPKTVATTSASVPTTTSAPAATTTKAPATTTQTTQAPQTGGTLKIIATIVFSDIGYPPMTVGDQIYAQPAVETLVTLDGQGKGQIIPELATDWQYSTDFKSLTFNLRKGVKFHDGTDFNAQAAKFCLDMVKTSAQGLLSSVASVDVVGDYTIRLNLSAYQPSLLLDLTQSRSGMMVSPTAIKSMSKEDAMTHPVGTGPFKFASYERSVSLKYTKFADYWQKGKPYLDGIEFNYVADSVTALASFQAGEGQAIRSPSAKDANSLDASGKFKVYRTPSSVRGLAFDSANSNSPFYDLKVRQAICYATDTVAINKACGYGLPMTNQFAVTDCSYYNPAVVGYPYNTQKAAELLAAAGYAKGFSTNINYENAGAIGTMCTAVQSYLRDASIDAKLVLQERAAMVQTRTGGWTNGMVWYDINFAGSADLGSRLISALSSKGTDYKSIFVPADYDAKLLQAVVEPNDAKRAALYQELEKMIIDTYCLAIPCYVNATFAATNLQVRDFTFNNYGQGIWEPENVWISK
jgi:peptide/nickel transport system substrate-binding protein